MTTIKTESASAPEPTEAPANPAEQPSAAAAAPEDPSAQAPASQPAEEEAPLTHSPAQSRMDAIERIAQSRAKIAGTAPESAEEPQPAQAPAAAAPQASAADQQLAAQMATDDRPIDPSARVRVKIEGQERDVPLADLVAYYQIDTTARERLNRATELLRQAQQTQQPAPAAAPDSGTVGKVPPAGDPSEKRRTVTKKVQDALGKVFAEGEEAAAEDLTEAMLEAIRSSQPEQTTPQLDPVRVAEMVEQQIEQRAALKEFLTTFDRIKANPYLAAAADDVFAQASQRNPSTPIRDVLRWTGEQVYKQFGYPLPASNPAQNPAPQARAETLAARKQGVTPLPIRTGSSLQSQEPPRNSEQTRASTVQAMAAARRPPSAPVR